MSTRALNVLNVSVYYHPDQLTGTNIKMFPPSQRHGCSNLCQEESFYLFIMCAKYYIQPFPLTCSVWVKRTWGLSPPIPVREVEDTWTGLQSTETHGQDSNHSGQNTCVHREHMNSTQKDQESHVWPCCEATATTTTLPCHSIMSSLHSIIDLTPDSFVTFVHLFLFQSSTMMFLHDALWWVKQEAEKQEVSTEKW